MINRYVSFGFVFLLFFGVGFVIILIINSNAILLPSNPSIFGNIFIFSLLSLFTNNYDPSNYDSYGYSFDKNNHHHLSLDFYNIPLVNAQEQNEEEEKEEKEEENEESNKNNNKFV